MKNCWFVVLSEQYSRHCCSMWVDWALSWLVGMKKKIFVFQRFCLWNAAKMSGECSDCSSIFCYISGYWSSWICQFFSHILEIFLNSFWFLKFPKKFLRNYVAKPFLRWLVFDETVKQRRPVEFQCKLARVVHCQNYHCLISVSTWQAEYKQTARADKKTAFKLFLLEFPTHLASVVLRLDSALHQINLYPVDSAITFPHTYPLDSDLSGG